MLLVSGFKGSGKDTVADWLVKHKGYKQLSFASALKDEVASSYGLPRENFYNQALKEVPFLALPALATDDTSRVITTHFLKELAFSDSSKPVGGFIIDNKIMGFKSIYSQSLELLYFTPRALLILHGALKRCVNPNHWVDVVMRQVKAGDKVVISDWRFKNELDAVNDWAEGQVTTVRINREASTSTDPTEIDLLGQEVDVTIDNTGSLEDLYKQLEDL